MSERGTIEGFTPELRELCQDHCADYGDPPCWKLPDMTSDCDGKVIRPCDDCLRMANLPFPFTLPSPPEQGEG